MAIISPVPSTTKGVQDVESLPEIGNDVEVEALVEYIYTTFGMDWDDILPFLRTVAKLMA